MANGHKTLFLLAFYRVYLILHLKAIFILQLQLLCTYPVQLFRGVFVRVFLFREILLYWYKKAMVGGPLTMGRAPLLAASAPSFPLFLSPR